MCFNEERLLGTVSVLVLPLLGRTHPRPGLFYPLWLLWFSAFPCGVAHCGGASW